LGAKEMKAIEYYHILMNNFSEISSYIAVCKSQNNIVDYLIAVEQNDSSWIFIDVDESKGFDLKIYGSR
jgi:hypothetical protein